MKKQNRLRQILILCSVTGLMLFLFLAIFIAPSEKLKCPPGFAFDKVKTIRIWGQLAMVRSHFPSLKRLTRTLPTLCFGAIQSSSITTHHIMLIDQRLKPKEAAARIAHLGQHILIPIRFDDRSPCTKQVEKALLLEAHAITIELKLRRLFRLSKPLIQFPFEKQFWNIPPKRQKQTIYQFLLKHPDGTPNFPPLGADYKQRCDKRMKPDKKV